VLEIPGHSGLGLGDKHLIPLEGCGVGVVAAVAEFEREVRDEKGRVEQEAKEMFYKLVIAKGVMAALVSDDPEAGEDAALTKPIKRPSQAV